MENLMNQLKGLENGNFMKLPKRRNFNTGDSEASSKLSNVYKYLQNTISTAITATTNILIGFIFFFLFLFVAAIFPLLHALLHACTPDSQICYPRVAAFAAFVSDIRIYD